MNPHDILRRLAPSDRPKNAETIPKNRPKNFRPSDRPKNFRPAVQNFSVGPTGVGRLSDGRRTVRRPSDDFLFTFM